MTNYHRAAQKKKIGIMLTPETLLREIFGFDSFRAGQRDIIDAINAGENVLAIMPTGGGKSLCYQLPALTRDGLTVVLSPLIALMRDQVRALQSSGVAAGALTSSNTSDENQNIFDQLNTGTLRILYISPERLASTAMQSALKRFNIKMIAVDEAHCVSQWGHDFRPDYLRIGELGRKLNVPLAAFTATADLKTRQEIIERLFNRRTPKIFLHGFDRPNIHLSFRVKDNPRLQLLCFVAERIHKSGIVYCGTRAKTESIAMALRELGHKACYYHGGMEADERRNVEAQFSAEDGIVVAATVAFGMGIDKPDVRWVAHADLPKSIESYYQEIGRAGRDGAPAEALTLYGADDIRLRRTQIDESAASEYRKVVEHERLNALLRLAGGLECRRKSLLRYFGENEVTCGYCDVCTNPPQTFDATTLVRKALSATLRTDQRYGTAYLIDLLVGKSTSKVHANGHHILPTFGVGKEISYSKWQSIFRQMMCSDLLRPEISRNGALCITQRSIPILRNEEKIRFREEHTVDTYSQNMRKMLIGDENVTLLCSLKAKRRELAKKADVAPFIVFNDKTLIEMAKNKPATLEEMALINGVGAKKLKRYGPDFLIVITGEKEHVHPRQLKLAGGSEGKLFDQLLGVQNALSRGPLGTDKPMSCSISLLVKITQLKPKTFREITTILGRKKAHRFGNAFLDVLGHVA